MGQRMKYAIKQPVNRSSWVLGVLAGLSLMACSSSGKKVSEPSSLMELYAIHQEAQAGQDGNIELLIDASLPTNATLAQKVVEANSLAARYASSGNLPLAEKAVVYVEDSFSQKKVVCSLEERYEVLHSKALIALAKDAVADIFGEYENAFSNVSSLDESSKRVIASYAAKDVVLLEKYLTSGSDSERIARQRNFAVLMDARLQGSGATSGAYARGLVTEILLQYSPTAKRIAFETAQGFSGRGATSGSGVSVAQQGGAAQATAQQSGSASSQGVGSSGAQNSQQNAQTSTPQSPQDLSSIVTAISEMGKGLHDDIVAVGTGVGEAVSEVHDVVTQISQNFPAGRSRSDELPPWKKIALVAGLAVLVVGTYAAGRRRRTL